jgi:DNA-directed RNA polymerase specialized sigma24 family protein
MMIDVTQLLTQMESGDPEAAEKLLPLVYDELRRLASSLMAQEQPGQMLQARALVHEAYLRLAPNGISADSCSEWDRTLLFHFRARRKGTTN